MVEAGRINDRNDGDTFKGFWRTLRIIGWSAAAVVLMLPLIFMQFTNEVDWSFSDFVFAAIILGGIGLMFEFLIRRSGDDAYRTGVIVTLATMFLLIWSNAAVGFIGSGMNFANILYAALVVVPVAGGIITGFKAKGMFSTIIVTAIAQAFITLIVFASGMVGEDEQAAIPVINALFVALWIGAALLFREASRPIDQRSLRILRIHFILSSLLIVIGAILLAFMVTVESEPGAIPLLILLIGIGWSLITNFRMRSTRNAIK